ncbi:MAG TPA: Asp-tRNA(Asn)/Glu-tRNA(Gln) amidotransferase subunit GatC [Candidatus Acidoferrales bacterium]|nr:Asp-tRNA(Asn)/Glu-tRNA(Gln) amidotransferase subunit GatC [Candidatus Acidoferrales bacterium]
MKVTEKDVLYVADLANLELTESERAGMVHDLNSILDHVDALSELDTTNVEPLTDVSAFLVQSSATNDDRYAYAQRPDEPRPSLPHEEAMKNAPDTNGSFFKVPKVIEK